MTVLTDDELAQVLRNRFTTECDARAIERAVVAKLHAQGIDTSPERVEKTPKRVHDDVELPSEDEAAAHMYSSALDWLKCGENTATAYSIPVRSPDERSQPLFTLDQVRAAVLVDRENRGGRLLAALQALEIARAALADIADLADHEADERSPIARIALARMGPLRYRALSAQEAKQ